MIATWISIPALLSVNLGFAGLLGSQIYRLRSQANSRQVAVALAISGLVMLPPLSLPPIPQSIGWLAATLVVVLFALRPNILPHQLWTLRFGFRYSCLAMILVAVWGLSVGFESPAFILGSFALLAAVLSWFRSRVTINEPNSAARISQHQDL